MVKRKLSNLQSLRIKLPKIFSHKLKIVGLGSLLFIGWIIAAIFYYPLSCTVPQGKSDPTLSSAQQKALVGHTNHEESSYLTFAEWYIVYSAQEVGEYLKNHNPSGFPYMHAVAQYWNSYRCVVASTQDRYPFYWGDHVVLAVIGASYSVEYTGKAAYEYTFGRISEWLSLNTRVDEDDYAQKVWEEYGSFLHATPWYEFPFGSKLVGLWTQTSLVELSLYRNFERKIVLSFEYGIKAAYGAVIRFATTSTYAPEDEFVYAIVETTPEAISKLLPDVQTQPIDTVTLVKLHRFDRFAGEVTKLAQAGIVFKTFGGADEIVISVLVPRSVDSLPTGSKRLFAMPVLGDSEYQRIVLQVPLTQLQNVLGSLSGNRTNLEHIYDY